jgi:hypothetical protein
MVGNLIRTRIGIDVTSTRAGSELQVDFSFKTGMAPQQYKSATAIHNPHKSIHDSLDHIVAFELIRAPAIPVASNLRARIKWHVSR